MYTLALDAIVDPYLPVGRRCHTVDSDLHNALDSKLSLRINTCHYVGMSPGEMTFILYVIPRRLFSLHARIQKFLSEGVQL